MQKENPFSKSNDIHSAVSDKARAWSADIISMERFLETKCPGITLTDSEKENLEKLDRPGKVKWLQAKLLETDYAGIMDMLSKGDVFKNVKDPLTLTEKDLDSMMRFKTDDEQRAELTSVLQDAKKKLMADTSEIYIQQRNKRLPDGSLDSFLSVNELRSLEREVDDRLNKMKRSMSGVSEGDKLSGLLNTFNDMSIDTKYAYEGYKEGICNDFGITPESFDEFMSAVFKENEAKLSTDGITIRTDMYKGIKDFHKKHAHLLKKVDGWKRGDIVYVSEFNKALREKEEAELRNSKSTEESRRLFAEMMADTYHPLNKPVSMKKNHISSDEAAMFVRKHAVSRRKKVSVSEEVEKVNNDKPVETTKPDISQFVVEEHIDKNQVEDSPKVIDNTFDQMKLENDKMQARIKELEKELSERKEHENMNKTEDNSVIDVVPPKDHTDTKLDNCFTTSIDDISTYIEHEADSSILRKPGSRVSIIKQYKESAKRGRSIFLPNSNYEVYVKKIKSTDSINYMMTLINNTKDMNLVESFIKSEILRICYENIEFSFEESPSYTDFVKCLHESDMTLLIMMLALVNIPEDENGKIILNVSSVMCSNPECNAIGHLKHKMKLDLKEEFVNIYPVERYASLYARYKSAGYRNIYEAYRNSEVGKITKVVVRDDLFEYTALLSSPTEYKTQAIKNSRDDVSYRRLLDRVVDRTATTNENNLVEIMDYMQSHTYHEFTQDVMDVTRNGNGTDNEKSILLSISEELENIKKSDLPFYLIMDVIDSLTVISLDGEEVVVDLDQSDVYTMIGILEETSKDLLDKIIDIKNKSLDKSYPVDIEFDAEDMAGKFDFDGYYGSDDEMVEEITRRYEGVKNVTQADIDKVIETQRKIRSESKPKYEDDAICFCGGHTWKLNYTAIIFFWTSNQSLIQVK